MSHLGVSSCIRVVSEERRVWGEGVKVESHFEFRDEN